MNGRRLSKSQIDELRKLWSDGNTKRELCAKYGISESCVSRYVMDVVRDPHPPTEPGEVWKDVVGLEGRYLVSSYGKIYSTPPSPAEHRLVKTSYDERGCPRFSVKCGRKRVSMRVPRVVAEAFLERESDDMTLVKHLDGDRGNNRVDNLAWTAEHFGPKVEFTDDEVTNIRQRWLDGELTADIARDYGVSYATVYKQLDGLKRDVTLPECEQGEEWAEVEGYSGRYYISSHGRLFSTGDGRRKAKLMSPVSGNDGYLFSQLYDKERHRGRTYPIHRLVAAAFCDGRTDERNCVNHIDGNILNNHADNLEWCTLAYNTKHAARVLGTIKAGDEQTHKRTRRTVPRDPTATRSPLRRFTDEQVVAIRNDQRSSEKVAAQYGVNKCTIQNIRSGKTYKDI